MVVAGGGPSGPPSGRCPGSGLLWPPWQCPWLPGVWASRLAGWIPWKPVTGELENCSRNVVRACDGSLLASPGAAGPCEGDHAPSAPSPGGPPCKFPIVHLFASGTVTPKASFLVIFSVTTWFPPYFGKTLAFSRLQKNQWSLKMLPQTNSYPSHSASHLALGSHPKLMLGTSSKSLSSDPKQEAGRENTLFCFPLPRSLCLAASPPHTSAQRG